MTLVGLGVLLEQYIALSRFICLGQEGLSPSVGKIVLVNIKPVVRVERMSRLQLMGFGTSCVEGERASGEEAPC